MNIDVKDMHMVDSSFLDNGLLPASIMSLTLTIKYVQSNIRETNIKIGRNIR